MKLSVWIDDSEYLRYESPKLNDLDKYEIFIGRSEDCHIHLDDNRVSRYHAVMYFSQGKWSLIKKSDIGEMLVNGINEEKCYLNVGDKIQISKYTIKINELENYTKVERPLEEIVPDSIIENFDEIESPKTLSKKEIKQEYQNDTGKESDGFPGDPLNDSPLNEEESFEENKNEQVEESVNFDDAVVSENENGFTEGKSESTQVLSSFVKFSLKIDGEFALYDRFEIDKNEIIIGRDKDKCDIFLDDPEVSTTHAKITKTLISCTLEDLNSSNGTFVNNERINKKELENGTSFKIGSTTFTLEIVSELLNEEEDRLMPVDEDQEIELLEEVEEEVDFEEGEGNEFDFNQPSEEKSLFKNPEKRKKLIIGAVILALVLLMVPTENTDTKKEDKKDNVTTVTPTTGKDEKGDGKAVAPKRVLTEEELRIVQSSYDLAISFIEQEKYQEADFEIQKVLQIDPTYKNAKEIETLARQAFQDIERKKKEIEEEKERQIRIKQLEELVKKAKAAVEKREVSVAEALFIEITAKDPENPEIIRLKLELEAYEKEQERIKLEAARVKAEREKMVDKLKPGKIHYIKKEWFKAIIVLEKFLEEKNMAEDLIKEATDMLAESKRILSEEISPLVGKARSLKEGQDLKAAYDVYLEILQLDPGHEESLTEIENIKNELENRSKKVYREALISESLSLFKEAKEKFQQVQQISPTDSEYYKKATEKLKDYIE